MNLTGILQAHDDFCGAHPDLNWPAKTGMSQHLNDRLLTQAQGGHALRQVGFGLDGRYLGRHEAWDLVECDLCGLVRKFLETCFHKGY